MQTPDALHKQKRVFRLDHMHKTMVFAVFCELCSAKTTSQGAPLLVFVPHQRKRRRRKIKIKNKRPLDYDPFEKKTTPPPHPTHALRLLPLVAGLARADGRRVRRHVRAAASLASRRPGA